MAAPSETAAVVPMVTWLIAATVPIAARPLPPEAIALSEAAAKRLKVNCVPCSGLRLSPKELRHGTEPLRSPRALGTKISIMLKSTSLSVGWTISDKWC